MTGSGLLHLAVKLRFISLTAEVRNIFLNQDAAYFLCVSVY